MADVVSGFARAADGTPLYWRAVGSGPPMVCCNGVGVSTFFWKYVTRHYRDRFTVVLWDYRGHGQSGPVEDPPHADLSMELIAQDLVAVLDDVGAVGPTVMLGHSMGVQVILEFARQHPERVRALVPMFGTFARPMDTFMDSPLARPIFDAINKLSRWTGRYGGRLLHPLYASPIALPIAGRTGLIDRFYADNRDIQMYIDHLVEMDSATFLRFVEVLSEHDMTAFLPKVAVPTLIFAGEKDLFTPLHRSYAMADAIPGAEIIVLAEASHAAIVEYPDTINRRLDRFLSERVYPADAARSSASSSREA